MAQPASATQIEITMPQSSPSTSIKKLKPTDFKEVMGVIQNSIGEMSAQIAKLKE